MRTETLYTMEEFEARWPNRVLSLFGSNLVVSRDRWDILIRDDANPSGEFCIDLGRWVSTGTQIKNLTNLPLLEDAIRQLTALRDFLKGESQ